VPGATEELDDAAPDRSALRFGLAWHFPFGPCRCGSVSCEASAGGVAMTGGSVLHGPKQWECRASEFRRWRAVSGVSTAAGRAGSHPTVLALLASPPRPARRSPGRVCEAVLPGGGGWERPRCQSACFASGDTQKTKDRLGELVDRGLVDLVCVTLVQPEQLPHLCLAVRPRRCLD
jgi:hypothetical protein